MPRAEELGAEGLLLFEVRVGDGHVGGVWLRKGRRGLGDGDSVIGLYVPVAECGVPTQELLVDKS